MIDVASQNGKLLMDGTMFMHHPQTRASVKSIPDPNRVSLIPHLIEETTFSKLMFESRRMETRGMHCILRLVRDTYGAVGIFGYGHRGVERTGERS